MFTFYVLDLGMGMGWQRKQSLESGNIGLVSSLMLFHLSRQTKTQQASLAYQLVLAILTGVILFSSGLYMIDVKTGTRKCVIGPR